MATPRSRRTHTEIRYDPSRVVYRNDEERLRAKVGELEAALTDTRAQLAALRGTGSSVVAIQGEAPAPLTKLGIPSTLRIEHVVDGELTVEGFEAIADVVRRRLGKATTQVGARLETLPRRAGDPEDRVVVLVRDGQTRIGLERDFREVPVTGHWVIGLTGMLGPLVAAIAGDLLHLSGTAILANMLWTTPLCGAIAVPAARALARGQLDRIRGELAERRGTFAAIVELAARHTTRAVPPTRVATVDADAHDEPSVEGDVRTRRAILDPRAR